MSGHKHVMNIFRLAGDFVHLLSIILLWMKMSRTRSCAGISLKSQLLFLAVYSTRYLDVFLLRFSTVIQFYNLLMKIVFITSQSLIIHSMLSKYRATYNPKLDTFRVEAVLVPCLALAIFIQSHRGGILNLIREVQSFSLPSGSLIFYILSVLSGSLISSLYLLSSRLQYFWTFSILLESVAILPQLFQLQKTGEAETITTHYLLCLGLYRAFYILNWFWRGWHREYPETVSFLAGILQTALYSDFFWIYYKRVFHGRAFKLPI